MNVPFVSVVDPETQAYLPADALRSQLERVGAMTAPRVVTYCGSGIAASSIAFSLALLGHDDVAVYDGSLSEWTTDWHLPYGDWVARGGGVDPGPSKCCVNRN